MPDNILELIESNEKRNEIIPESIQQASKLLSIDNRFYNVKNTLFMFEDYQTIARKLHERNHQFDGIVQCIQILNNFLFVGNSQGIIRVFDLQSEKEMKPLMDPINIGYENVTCIDIHEQAGLLISGYSNGSIVLWDLINYKLLKNIGDMHHSTISNIKIYFINNNGT